MILLLCGYKRCGKDECASFLESELNFQHFKISKYLKELLTLLFGFQNEQLEGTEKETVSPEWNVTPRDVMKFVGTNLFQFEIQKLLPHIDRDFWLHLLRKDIELNRRPNTPIVISDLRFSHELEFFTRIFPREKIIVVNVLRSSVHKTDFVPDPSEDEHTKMPHTHVVQNNTSLYDLRVKLRQLIESEDTIRLFSQISLHWLTGFSFLCL